MATKQLPQIAILGAGIFVKTQYLPRLSEISHLFILKSIWSRTQESATAAVDIARKHFPQVETKWGDNGFDDIIHDGSIDAVAVVLAGQNQVDISLRLLKAGKHVLQGTSELEAALSSYKSISSDAPGQLIWSVAENYRFEPGLVEGGFILDMGVHFIAGLRMTLWRVVGLNGTLQVERGFQGQHGYLVSFYGTDGQNKSSFFPFSGVTEELKAFINDVSEITLKKRNQFVTEPRLSYVEGARDVAVLEAMLESGARQGELVRLKKF
ncbi:hypothetical protein JHK85_038846 [Glycine max]|nr:hypothetical protein JHK85_038846 [Glycine max]